MSYVRRPTNPPGLSTPLRLARPRTTREPGRVNDPAETKGTPGTITVPGVPYRADAPTTRL
ncbi:hypothetical protein ACFVQ4_27480 [Streptomyces laurentii]|uniref:hypothetical protein n=1 Tax=Streptomyces laurentii TaxID=39478 RepID=UPI0036B7AF45